MPMEKKEVDTASDHRTLIESRSTQQEVHVMQMLLCGNNSVKVRLFLPFCLDFKRITRVVDQVSFHD
jgi:hypothetical protein